jgi:hypothetical protein
MQLARKTTPPPPQSISVPGRQYTGRRRFNLCRQMGPLTGSGHDRQRLVTGNLIPVHADERHGHPGLLF